MIYFTRSRMLLCFVLFPALVAAMKYNKGEQVWATSLSAKWKVGNIAKVNHESKTYTVSAILKGYGAKFEVEEKEVISDDDQARFEWEDKEQARLKREDRENRMRRLQGPKTVEQPEQFVVGSPVDVKEKDGKWYRGEVSNWNDLESKDKENIPKSEDNDAVFVMWHYEEIKHAQWFSQFDELLRHPQSLNQQFPVGTLVEYFLPGNYTCTKQGGWAKSNGRWFNGKVTEPDFVSEPVFMTHDKTDPNVLYVVRIDNEQGGPDHVWVTSDSLENGMKLTHSYPVNTDVAVKHGNNQWCRGTVTKPDEDKLNETDDARAVYVLYQRKSPTNYGMETRYNYIPHSDFKSSLMHWGDYAKASNGGLDDN